MNARITGAVIAALVLVALLSACPQEADPRPGISGSVEIGFTGALAVGTLLVATPDLESAGTPLFQWQRGGAADGPFYPIPGSRGSTHTVLGGDINHLVRVAVTLAGHDGEITSDPTPVVPDPGNYLGLTLAGPVYFNSADLDSLPVYVPFPGNRTITLPFGSATISGGRINLELVRPADSLLSAMPAGLGFRFIGWEYGVRTRPPNTGARAVWLPEYLALPATGDEPRGQLYRGDVDDTVGYLFVDRPVVIYAPRYEMDVGFLFIFEAFELELTAGWNPVRFSVTRTGNPVVTTNTVTPGDPGESIRWRLWLAGEDDDAGWWPDPQ